MFEARKREYAQWVDDEAAFCEPRIWKISQAHQKATLPQSMVPAEFVIVSGLPLASNGATNHTASPPSNSALEAKSAAAR